MAIPAVKPSQVHGDIRHLEIVGMHYHLHRAVHGDIRHLEKLKTDTVSMMPVHGDIRHLEKSL